MYIFYGCMLFLYVTVEEDLSFLVADSVCTPETWRRAGLKD
jgi:hypothetical protein